MPLTRNFKHTVIERVERDPAFAKALLDEAASLFLNGEAETARRTSPSRKAIVRAVASSTAVETGGDVAELEQLLEQGALRFPHIKLGR